MRETVSRVRAWSRRSMDPLGPSDLSLSTSSGRTAASVQKAPSVSSTQAPTRSTSGMTASPRRPSCQPARLPWSRARRRELAATDER